MELEFNDLEVLDDNAKMGYFENKMRLKLGILALENDEQKTAEEEYMLENLRFDLLDQDIVILHDKMTDETLAKIADVYKKARIELEKIVAEAERKE